jgi:hypothetical protein
MHQKNLLLKLNMPLKEPDFVPVRARGQIRAGQVRNQKSEDFAQIRKIVARIEETSQVGLSFRPLNIHSLQIRVFSDAAFMRTNLDFSRGE